MDLGLDDRCDPLHCPRQELSAADWRVENNDADGDGACEVAIFSGPRAEERARLFAKAEHGASYAEVPNQDHGPPG
jgi:hypothetical protein